MRARPAGEIFPLRVLLAPVRAETALYDLFESRRETISFLLELLEC